jgi:predicted transporter
MHAALGVGLVVYIAVIAIVILKGRYRYGRVEVIKSFLGTILGGAMTILGGAILWSVLLVLAYPLYCAYVLYLDHRKTGLFLMIYLGAAILTLLYIYDRRNFKRTHCPHCNSDVTHVEAKTKCPSCHQFT